MGHSAKAARSKNAPKGKKGLHFELATGPQVLVATLAWNHGELQSKIGRASSDLPLRTPPYYAFKCMCRIMNTMGGIKINEKMEVLSQNEKPIPGLYAAGVDTGGWTSDTYCTAEPGTAFGFALNSGRIAGESATKFVSGK